MDTLLNRVTKEHRRLLDSDKIPDALFLNKDTHRQLEREWSASAGRSDVLALSDFLGMEIHESDRYLTGQFRVYCKFTEFSEL